MQFLTKLGLPNLNIECIEGVHIFYWLWNGRKFCLNLSQFDLFSKKRIDVAIMDSLWYCYNYISLIQRYWKYLFWIWIENYRKLEICKRYRKVKQSKLVITTWKLPISKVYCGLNNALGICAHEKHYKVSPTQMVPICEHLGFCPWTISNSAMYLFWEHLWDFRGSLKSVIFNNVTYLLWYATDNPLAICKKKTAKFFLGQLTLRRLKYANIFINKPKHIGKFLTKVLLVSIQLGAH